MEGPISDDNETVDEAASRAIGGLAGFTKIPRTEQRVELTEPEDVEPVVFTQRDLDKVADLCFSDGLTRLAEILVEKRQAMVDELDGEYEVPKDRRNEGIIERLRGKYIGLSFAIVEIEKMLETGGERDGATPQGSTDREDGQGL